MTPTHLFILFEERSSNSMNTTYLVINQKGKVVLTRQLPIDL
jgi:hypothetical protein